MADMSQYFQSGTPYFDYQQLPGYQQQASQPGGLLGMMGQPQQQAQTGGQNGYNFDSWMNDLSGLSQSKLKQLASRFNFTPNQGPGYGGGQ